MQLHILCCTIYSLYQYAAVSMLQLLVTLWQQHLGPPCNYVSPLKILFYCVILGYYLVPRHCYQSFGIQSSGVGELISWASEGLDTGTLMRSVPVADIKSGILLQSGVSRCMKKWWVIPLVGIRSGKRSPRKNPSQDSMGKPLTEVHVKGLVLS